MNLIIDANNISNIAYHRAKMILLKKNNNVENIDEKLSNFSTKIFLNILHKYIKDFDYPIIYIVWDDRKGSHWRKENNINYKSNRDHSKDNYYRCFIQSIQDQKKLIESYPAYQLQKEFAEADDIIYNLCSILNEATIISSDGDMIQLAQKFNNIQIWNPSSKKYVDIPEYDVVLYKSIVGDNSDNIQGLYKFGHKRAIKSIESNLSNLSQEQLKIIEENKKIIDLSLNPNIKNNTEYVINYLKDSKIKLNPKAVKKIFFDLQLLEFLKKWDSIYNMLLQLEKESINGGKKAS